MNDNNEMLTKGMFRDAMDELARLINKSFQGVESRMDGMATHDDLLVLIERVDAIELRLNDHDKEFRGIHQKIDAMFLELKDIRREIKEADTRADVVDLQIRVGKLEKKVR